MGHFCNPPTLQHSNNGLIRIHDHRSRFTLFGSASIQSTKAMLALFAACAALAFHAQSSPLELAAIDCHAFHPAEVMAGLDFPLTGANDTVFARLSNEKGGLGAVAADGVSLVLIRAKAGSAETVHFSVAGVGGWLYPLVGDPFRKTGVSTLDVPTSQVVGEHLAFALYRPPSSYGASPAAHVPITFEARAGDQKRTLNVWLVRPPVVLVHGTYDNPLECWEKIEEGDESKVSMQEFLLAHNIRPYCVDWEATNGSKNPSDFRTNQKAVYQNKDGIKFAIARYRANGIAVTQADVVCHSQGGVIARVYARGFPLDKVMHVDDAHFTNPEACAQDGCWYHRAENYCQGDIHRLITISSTHRGSDVCRLFNAYDKYTKTHGFATSNSMESVWLDLFCAYVNEYESGIKTGGFYNQTPASRELIEIGPTPIPSHAIACVADDHDVETGHGGSYYTRLLKIWLATPADQMAWALDHMQPANKDDDGKNLLYLLHLGLKQADIVKYLRAAVFNHDENDVTVAMTSSFGGMSPAYRTKLEHVLHGWAPRYVKVQQRVLQLLTDDGALFDRNGFPNPYTGERSGAANFNVEVPRATASAPEVQSGISGYWLWQRTTKDVFGVTNDLVPAYLDAQNDGVTFKGEYWPDLTVTTLKGKFAGGHPSYSIIYKQLGGGSYSATNQDYPGGPITQGQMTLSGGVIKVKWPTVDGVQYDWTWVRPNSQQLAELRAFFGK